MQLTIKATLPRFLGAFIIQCLSRFTSMEKTATGKISQRSRTNIGIFESHTCDKTSKWEINDQDGKDFQKLTRIFEDILAVRL